jgi:acyl-CoA synthetase (AMP-forming)/AMP-acid ligase II
VMVAAVVGDAMARPLAAAIERGTADVSSLAVVANGGALLTPTTKQRLIDAKPGLIVVDGVGSSETGAQLTHMSAPGAVSTGTFKPGPDTFVVSEDLGGVLEEGHAGIGWLAQRGYVPLGYMGDVVKTATTFPVVAGVRCAVPGDRARHLADGAIELLGRDSVTINSGGEKIFAEEVEMAVASHPAVADVVVAGRPKRAMGPGGRRRGGADRWRYGRRRRADRPRGDVTGTLQTAEGGGVPARHRAKSRRQGRLSVGPRAGGHLAVLAASTKASVLSSTRARSRSMRSRRTSTLGGPSATNACRWRSMIARGSARCCSTVSTCSSVVLIRLS